MRYKTIKLGNIGLMISVEDRLAQNFFANLVYRIVAGRGKVPVKTPEFHKQPQSQQTSESFEGTPEQKQILQKIAGIQWYHSIDLGHGVLTPGNLNHIPYLSHYPVPERLDGMRVLEVATFDGFWAFQFDRRGASEVIALDIESWNDIDLSPVEKAKMTPKMLNRKTGQGFHVAREILGAKVNRKILSVYDLSPTAAGKFDMVFCSDLLLHLMNPMKALQNIYSVTSGFAIIAEPFDPDLDLISPNKPLMHYKGCAKVCTWWNFSLKALEHMIRDAGFKKVELMDTFELGVPGRTEKSWHAVFRASS